ncbi:hypothetical protein FQA38_22980 [Salmonella enterica]|nr:hypothetical protein [Salmonella enterica]
MTINSLCIFDENSIPMLLPQSKITVTGKEVILFTPGQEYTISGESADIIHSISDKLTGTCTMSHLAETSGYPVDKIITLANYLETEHILIDINNENKDMLSGRELVSLVENEVNFWRKHINNQPFWTRVHNGECTQREILGWGVEFYHYVDAANEYMAAGVAWCRESIDVRQKLSAQYAEEAAHGEIFLQGLKTDGLPSELIVKSSPLPSTRALINYLNEIATESTLVYSAIFALMQSDGNDFNEETLKRYYGNLKELYPFAQGMFAAFLRHALIDVHSGHQVSIFARLYDNNIIISGDQVKRVFTTLRQLTHYFILFYEYIHEYYTQASSPLPRRPPQISDFVLADSRES